MSNYYKLIVQIEGEEEQENLIAHLNWFSDFESVQQEHDHIDVSYNLDKQSKDALLDAIKESQWTYSYSIEDEPDINWNETYEKSFQPITIMGNEWGVRASFHPALDVKNEIVIDPKMSFGTGHHDTTRQMMELMTSADFVDQSVWDYGSGTGILAIMAEKLGARSVVGNDNEEWAYNNSIENAKINHCTCTRFELGTIEDCEAISFLDHSEKFDIIIANITKNILLESAFKIDSYSRVGSVLFLSGFYEKDIVDIQERYQAIGFQLEKQSVANDWACLKLVKS